jgi:hypothetical protein
MSEEMPGNKSREVQEPVDDYFDWLGQDKEDPERGPVVRMTEAVFRSAVQKLGTPLMEEFLALQHSFPRDAYYQYRLYHYLIGSTPPRDIVLFDAEGDASVAEKVRALAEKYHIDLRVA